MIKERFVEFGQGTQRMSPALRDLEEVDPQPQAQTWRPSGPENVRRQCVIEGKDASNRKLSKKRTSGRIDGMIALAMAVGVAPLSPSRIDAFAMIG